MGAIYGQPGAGDGGTESGMRTTVVAVGAAVVDEPVLRWRLVGYAVGGIACLVLLYRLSLDILL
jgi:hypothetical protein